MAAAIPGLTPDQVTVLTTDGTLLASGDDSASAAPEKLIEMEHTVSADLQQKLERTFAPYLGVDNFRISVLTKLNTDRKQINETNYDPNSRVERSVRSIKESGETQNANGAPPVSVQQNVPQEAAPVTGADSSREKKDHKEELTNYEINSKQIATTSDGYSIDQISVAVVLNRMQLAKTLGPNPAAGAMDSALKEIEQLAFSAAGLNAARGDRVKVTAVDFVAPEESLPSAAEPSVFERLSPSFGTLIRSGTLIIVTLLAVMLGLRPSLKMLATLPLPTTGGLAISELAEPVRGHEGISSLPRSAGGTTAGNRITKADSANEDAQFDALARQLSNSPRERLEKIVELDPGRAAQVLKQWLEVGEGADT